MLRCGLVAGTRLERPLLRQLRRALQEVQALHTGLRALERRPLSERRLRERVRGRGLAWETEEAVVRRLTGAGLVDDSRIALARALVLAERGWGNEAIRAKLESEGFPERGIREAVEELAPEHDRACTQCRGLPPRKAWGLLARRGFDPDIIASAVGPLDADE